MEIHVYDRSLRRLGHIENHTSLQWHRKYYECGTFELHCPVTAENLRLLKPGNVIAKGDNKLEAAVIRGDQTEEESTLVNEITRNGKFLPVYLGDRLTGPLFNYSGTVEDAMRFMLGRMAAVPSCNCIKSPSSSRYSFITVPYRSITASQSITP